MLDFLWILESTWLENPCSIWVHDQLFFVWFSIFLHVFYGFFLFWHRGVRLKTEVRHQGAKIPSKDQKHQKTTSKLRSISEHVCSSGRPWAQKRAPNGAQDESKTHPKRSPKLKSKKGSQNGASQGATPHLGGGHARTRGPPGTVRGFQHYQPQNHTRDLACQWAIGPAICQDSLYNKGVANQRI